MQNNLLLVKTRSNRQQMGTMGSCLNKLCQAKLLLLPSLLHCYAAEKLKHVEASKLIIEEGSFLSDLLLLHHATTILGVGTSKQVFRCCHHSSLSSTVTPTLKHRLNDQARDDERRQTTDYRHAHKSPYIFGYSRSLNHQLCFSFFYVQNELTKRRSK